MISYGPSADDDSDAYDDDDDDIWMPIAQLHMAPIFSLAFYCRPWGHKVSPYICICDTM